MAHFTLHGLCGKGSAWLKERWPDLLSQSVIFPLVTGFFGWLASQLVAPGMVRDIGFYVIVLGMITASTVLIIWLDKRKIAHANASAATTSANCPFPSFLIVYRVQVWPMLNEHEPQLIFRFWIFNGEKKSLYVKSVSGQVKFLNVELAGMMERRSGQEDIMVGAKYKLEIRQFVGPETAKRLSQSVGISGKGQDFSFDSVNVMFGSRDIDMGGIEGKLDLPRMVYRESWIIQHPSD